MSSSCAMGATTSGGSPSCASSLAVRRYMCPLGVMCVRYMCPLFIYMELSVYMELSRLSGRLYGDSGRLCGTTLATLNDQLRLQPPGGVASPLRLTHVPSAQGHHPDYKTGGEPGSYSTSWTPKNSKVYAYVTVTNFACNPPEGWRVHCA